MPSWQTRYYRQKSIFQVKQNKYDNNYIITSLPFARRLFNRQGEITSLELRLKAGEDIDKVKGEIEHIVGNQTCGKRPLRTTGGYIQHYAHRETLCIRISHFHSNGCMLQYHRVAIYAND